MSFAGAIIEQKIDKAMAGLDGAPLVDKQHYPICIQEGDIIYKVDSNQHKTPIKRVTISDAGVRVFAIKEDGSEELIKEVSNEGKILFKKAGA